MSFRSDPDEVVKLIQGGVPGYATGDPDGLMTPWIDTADNIVTRVCTDSTYDDATKELIERWLAAHFYAVHAYQVPGLSGGTQSQKTGQASFSSGTSKVYGTAFEFTRYGQAAMEIDTAGGLARLNQFIKSGKAFPAPQVIAAGPDPARTPYDFFYMGYWDF